MFSLKCHWWVVFPFQKNRAVIVIIQKHLHGSLVRMCLVAFFGLSVACSLCVYLHGFPTTDPNSKDRPPSYPNYPRYPILEPILDILDRMCLRFW